MLLKITEITTLVLNKLRISSSGCPIITGTSLYIKLIITDPSSVSTGKCLFRSEFSRKSNLVLPLQNSDIFSFL